MSMRNMVERGNPVLNIPTEKGGKFKTDALMKYIDILLVLFSTTYVAFRYFRHHKYYDDRHPLYYGT